MPEWKKVESPMTAIVRVGLSGPRMSRAVWNPSPAAIDAPMSIHVSMAENGGSAPSV